MAVSMGQIIKELRKKNGFTQEELAKQLGVTYQAVSKWENGTGMPDISQVVPLASIFHVSTDVLFGLVDTNENDEVSEIVRRACVAKKYRAPDSRLQAYDILSAGLKKYPNNLTLMLHCMRLGVSLSVHESERLYTEGRAKEILSETIRQANFVTQNAKNIADVLSARQALVFMYCEQGEFDRAIGEAKNFPPRADLTSCSAMATVYAYRKNHEQAARCLCTHIDYTLQSLEDHIARLGKAYYHDGKYADAASVYETFFEVVRAIFKDELPLNYHDFDSGDCYLLLAEAYLAMGKTAEAMQAVERSVTYYTELCRAQEDPVLQRQGIRSPVLRGTEIVTSVPKDAIKQKLLHKLHDDRLRPLTQTPRFAELTDIVTRLL